MPFKTRKAFTMIEVIFVIAIIGILAAVALPKLAANRDNATGSMCTHEVGQLIHEISRAHIASGTKGFSELNISTITNLKTNIGTSGQGISEASTAKVDTQGITYKCDGEPLMFMVGNYISSENAYTLSITDLSPTRPSAVNAAIQLRKLHNIAAGGTRRFRL